MSRRIAAGFRGGLVLSFFPGGLLAVSAQMEVRARPPASDSTAQSTVARISDRPEAAEQVIVGTPTVGEMGVTETVEQIMAREAMRVVAGVEATTTTHKPVLH